MRGKRRQEESGIQRDKGFDMEAWTPITEMGKQIKAGEIVNIDEILDNGRKILEPTVVDAL